MTNILKWVATITLVAVVGSNAFDTLYDMVYPWNVLGGAIASTMLIWVSIAQKDKQYLMLNTIVAGLYCIGFIQEIL